MKAFPHFVLTPQFRIHAALLTVIALGCTQIPLFNYLGFEFSALMAIVGGYSAGLLTISLAQRDATGTPLTKLYGPLAGTVLLLLAAPFVLISLNAFLVRNCSFADGIMFFALSPIPAFLFASAVALVVLALVQRWRKTMFTFIYALVLAHILIVTILSPQVFAFNPVIGFFPGITYDESMSVGGRLVLYRVTTLVAITVLVVFAEVVRRARAGRVALWNAMTRTESVVFGAGAVILLAAWLFSDSLSHSSSEASIRKELGGELITEHFVLVYPLSLEAEAVSALARDHEFYFAEIARQLRVLPSEKITSFLYASAGQKERLIGAGGTNIAKPWLRQMHMNLADTDRALQHELVHVMAGDFGFPVLRVGMNSGLIEGLATAIERVQYDETLHRLAAQIVAVGIEPDMESLFSITGFLKGHGGTSYMLAGSFCRYLIDQYGMRRFKWVYRTGSFETFYNRRLEVLVAEWRRYISQPEPTVQERTRAAFYFRRPSIFAKECARVIAGLNEETAGFIRKRRWNDAIESSRRSLEFSRSPEAITQHVLALTRSGRHGEAIRFGMEALQDSSRAHTLLPTYLTLGDASWAIGDLANAKRLYEALYNVHVSTAYDEACGTRLEVMQRRDERELREFVTGHMTDSLRIPWLQDRIARKDSSLLMLYLLGREYMNAGKSEEALRVLVRIRSLGAGILDFMRMRRIARLYYERGDYQKAKMYFWESLNYTPKESHRIETEEWLKKCDWSAQPPLLFPRFFP